MLLFFCFCSRSILFLKWSCNEYFAAHTCSEKYLEENYAKKVCFAFCVRQTGKKVAGLSPCRRINRIATLLNTQWALVVGAFIAWCRACSARSKTVQAGVIAVLCISALLACPTTQAVSGGSASTVPWVVQVVGTVNGQPDSACSGAAISAQVIITAKHCKADFVAFADRNVSVISRHDLPVRDAQLLVLAAPYALAEYPRLGANHVAENWAYLPGTMGTFYGYGASYPGIKNRLNLRLRHHGPTPASSEELVMAADSGELNRGDSGGPLVIDGVLVGVFSGPGINLDDKSSVYHFVGLSLALSRIAELQNRLRAKSFVASEL